MPTPRHIVSHRLWRLKAFFGLALAMLALMFQALVPSGYMVTQAKDSGLLAITLCTSKGNVIAYMDQEGHMVDASPHDDPSEDPETNKSPCAFAAHNVTVTPPDFVTLDVPANNDQVLGNLHFAYIAPGLGLAAPPPPKTGPPIHA